MQDSQDYDLHIIYIRGNGECRDKSSYQEFYEILDRTKLGNTQLSSDDERILDIIKKTNFNAGLF